MAFPATPLPIRVKIAPGAAPAAHPSTWPSWVDISASVRVDAGIQISDGRSDEGALVDAASMSLTLDDRVGDYNPVNPLGIYYPLLRRGCPIRVGTDILSDDFNRTVSGGWGPVSNPALASGLTWPSSASLSTNGTQAQFAAPVGAVATVILLSGAEASDVEGRVTVTPGVVATGASIAMGAVVRRDPATTAYYGPLLSFDLAGSCKVVIGRRSTAGSFGNLATFALPTTYTAGQLWTLAWQVIGPTICAKAWPTASVEPPGWQVGYTDPGGQVTGTLGGLLAWRQTGNTNAGTTIPVSFDDYRLEHIEYAGNIVEFPVTWDQSGRDSFAQIKAGGPFRRLQQGQTPLKSPLAGQLSSAAASGPVLGLWMMEDDAGTIAASSQAPGGTSASVTDVSFGAATDLPGSLQQVRLNSSASRISGTTRARVTPGAPNGLNFTAFYKLSGTPSATNITLASIGSTGPITNWSIQVNNASMSVTGFDSDGAVVASPGAVLLPSPFSFTQWFAITFYANNTAGTTVSYNMYLHQVGVSFGFASGPSGTYATTVYPSCTGFNIAGNGVMASGFIGPIRIGDNNFPFLTGTFKNVAAGWFGELASDRIVRLCQQAGVSASAEMGLSEPMGIQRVNSLFSLLRECEAADQGILYESAWGVTYRPRVARYSRSTVLTLDRNSGHLAAPPTPTLDDQRLINDVTLSRDGGAQGVRVFDATSVTNEGTYDTSLTINTATDDVLSNHAAWRVYLGIQPELRWPDITLNLLRNTSLIPSWRSRVFADRMTVASELTQVAGSPPNVIIEGTTQFLSSFAWDIQCNCSPAKPWDVATLDDTNLRLDTTRSMVGVPPSPAATGTSLTVVTLDGPAWVDSTNYPAEFPFSATIAGEVVTVTAIAGTRSPQTWTVTRNVNALPGGKAQVTGYAAQDSFTRSASSSWGSANTGGAYTNTGGSASDFSVSGTKGVHLMSTVNVSRRSLLAATTADVDQIVRLTINQASTGGFAAGGLHARFIDASNYYAARAEFTSTATVTLTFRKVVAGVTTDLAASIATGLAYVSGTDLMMHMLVSGTRIAVKVWLASTTEPDTWNFDSTDTALAAAGTYGPWSILSSANTNVSPTISFDDYGVIALPGVATVGLTRPMILAL